MDGEIEDQLVLEFIPPVFRNESQRGLLRNSDHSTAWHTDDIGTLPNIRIQNIAFAEDMRREV